MKMCGVESGPAMQYSHSNSDKMHTQIVSGANPVRGENMLLGAHFRLTESDELGPSSYTQLSFSDGH